MNEDTDIQAVQQLYNAFGQGNLDTILNALADDVEWHQPGPPTRPLTASGAWCSCSVRARWCACGPITTPP